jgi:tRNA(fMet)-specific endonuclease VapC
LPRYLLDTNILSAAMRAPQGPVAQRIARAGSSNVCSSIIVLAELRFGVAKRKSVQLANALARVLEALEVVPFEAPADVIYARLRLDVERQGKLIGANDLLIAAHALALDCTLVTDNEREFARVDGLAVENWLR